MRASVDGKDLQPTTLTTFSDDPMSTISRDLTTNIANHFDISFFLGAADIPLPKRTMNSQGLELQIATNYFGLFLLTALLFPLMKEEEGSRIVTVSSTVERSARLEFDNLQSERRYVPHGGDTPNQNWQISSSLLSCIDV